MESKKKEFFCYNFYLHVWWNSTLRRQRKQASSQTQTKHTITLKLFFFFMIKKWNAFLLWYSCANTFKIRILPFTLNNGSTWQRTGAGVTRTPNYWEMHVWFYTALHLVHYIRCNTYDLREFSQKPITAQ